MNTIEGIIEEIVYKNEANGYAVCQLLHGKDSTTIVGYLPYINEGESLKVSGNWSTHPDYGDQLKVEYFEKVAPSTIDAIEKYLASGIISGIGPRIAKKIVERFGENSLFIIENNPEELASISGISYNKSIAIREAYLSQIEVKQVVMFLQGYGVSSNFAVKIYKKFGASTINIIKENPYILADEIVGIGFKTADLIAMKLGVETNSEYRICSGAKYVLSSSMSSGHTYMPREDLIRDTSNLLRCNQDSVQNALIKLVIEKKVYIEKINEQDAVYLSPLYFAEYGVVRKLMDLSCYKPNNNVKDIDKEIEIIEIKQGITLEETQKLAIRESLDNGVIVITGGPGTGKTTILNCMLKLFDDLHYDVVLAAPTGRAAKRMGEACSREAKTIHRLLEIEYIEEGEEQNFSKNEDNPLKTNVVIIDEVSMVDINLMNSLLKAISIGTRLILVGDIDQLPSVGPGTVLKDIIESGMVNVVRLTEIFRQARESMIVVNAHKINKGEYPFLNIADKDFFLIRKRNHNDILKEILGLIKERIPKYNNYDCGSIQVLSPMRKGQTGVNNLNNELQKVLNPSIKSKKEKIFKDITFREGDKVMQIKNNYNITWKNILTSEEGVGVFNGDIGIIDCIDSHAETVNVLFDEIKSVDYNYADLIELELAYAITVHKSQGCEFPVVIMPIFTGPQILFTRNLLYTAITRSKELVVLVGSEENLKYMIDNNSETKRYSGLCQRLKKVII